MDMVEMFLQNNKLYQAEEVDSLIETASLMRELISNNQHSGICRILRYAIENAYFEAFSWCIALLQEALKKEDCELKDFECMIGKSIPHYDMFIECLQVDIHSAKNGLERIYDKNGEVESFFNILTYKTGYENIYLVSSENFDTKDNDFVQYKLSFVKSE